MRKKDSELLSFKHLPQFLHSKRGCTGADGGDARRQVGGSSWLGQRRSLSRLPERLFTRLVCWQGARQIDDGGHWICFFWFVCLVWAAIYAVKWYVDILKFSYEVLVDELIFEVKLQEKLIRLWSKKNCQIFCFSSWVDKKMSTRKKSFLSLSTFPLLLHFYLFPTTFPALPSFQVVREELPRCDSCNQMTKPDIVFFGEHLPGRFFSAVNKDLPKCDLLIIMGTSLVVQPFASMVDRVSDFVSLCIEHWGRVLTRQVVNTALLFLFIGVGKTTWQWLCLTALSCSR